MTQCAVGRAVQVAEAMKPYMFEQFGNPSSTHVYGRQVGLQSRFSADGAVWHDALILVASNNIQRGLENACSLRGSAYIWPA